MHTFNREDPYIPKQLQDHSRLYWMCLRQNFQGAMDLLNNWTGAIGPYCDENTLDNAFHAISYCKFMDKTHNTLLQDMVGKMLEVGLDINQKNMEGKTPLSLSITNKFNDLTKCFIEHGADINEPDDNGFSALMLFVLHNINKDIEYIKQGIEYLISKGADINRNYISTTGDTHNLLSVVKNTYIYEVTNIRSFTSKKDDNKKQNILSMIEFYCAKQQKDILLDNIDLSNKNNKSGKHLKI